MSLIYTAPSNSSSHGGSSVGKRNSLYVGGRSDAKDRDKLRRWGVSHVLNVTAAKDAGVKVNLYSFYDLFECGWFLMANEHVG